MGIGGAIALDTTAEVYRAYDRLIHGGAVAPFPRQYVIDPSAQVVYASPRYDPAAIRKTLDGLLKSPNGRRAVLDPLLRGPKEVLMRPLARPSASGGPGRP